jgi:very-long-chain enoyl-CoA reductase
MEIVRIRNFLETINYSELDLELDISKPFSDNLESIKKKITQINDRDTVNYFLVHERTKTLIEDFSLSLNSYGYRDGDILSIEASKKPLSVPPFIVGTLAYAGPIVVFLLFWLSHEGTLNLVQTLGLILTILHYGKRIYEVNFVHEWATENVSLFNGGIFGLMIYYWVLYGVCVAYFIFNHDSKPLFPAPVLLGLSVLMLISEYGNYSAHRTLKKLKEENFGKRGIPRGGLFEYVSCPHYFFELCSWFIFSLIVNTVTSYLFVLYSLISMGTLAIKKHKAYLDYFKEKYPKDRKAMIPYIF